MKTIINNQLLYPPHYQDNYTPTISKQEHVIDKVERITKDSFNEDIKGEIRSILIDDIAIDEVNLKQKSPFDFHVVKDEEHIEMYFELEGTKHYNRGGKNKISTSNGRYSLFYCPQIDGTLSFLPHNGSRKSIGIELSFSFLCKLFNNDLSVFNDFGRKMINKQEAIYAQNATISLPMMLILRDITQCKLSGILKKIFIESKVIELLRLIIEQNNNQSQQSISPFLSKEDVDKVYYARELVSNNIDNPYSIRELSRMAGLNEFKLKRGFKEVFDTTVFKYLLDERMVYGYKLLVESEKSIGEISTSVGYKNPTHFTVAFKKYFGHLPSNIKNCLELC